MENRKLVKLVYNCTEGKKWDIVLMQDDMIKAYGSDYVEIVKDKELEATVEAGLKYAEENGINVGKNLNVERFLKRIEAVKQNKEALAEQAKVDENAGKAVEALEKEKAAFEEIKIQFAEEKQQFEKDLQEREALLDKREEELKAREDELNKTEGEEKVEDPKKETKNNK